MTKANISMVTLGVEDLLAATAFYQAMGWTLCEPSNENISFLDGGSVVLSLYGHAALAEDSGEPSDGSGFRGVSCAFNQPSEAEVDAYMARAKAAGARIVKVPERVFWGGYSGYFADADGHLWEVAHNPFATLDESGRIKLEPKAT
ncbi:VOC family protein [Rhizobiaceae bacterium]|nr:VOC family protein [Rhizobiaceae bacterium]